MPESADRAGSDGSGLDTIAGNPKLSGPAWSSDGQRIVYFAGTDFVWPLLMNQRGFWSVKPDGTDRTKIRDLPPGTDSYNGLQFSPAGTKLAMCHSHTNGSTLEVMNANGSGLVSLLLGCESYEGYSEGRAAHNGPPMERASSRSTTMISMSSPPMAAAESSSRSTALLNGLTGRAAGRARGQRSPTFTQ